MTRGRKSVLNSENGFILLVQITLFKHHPFNTTFFQKGNSYYTYKRETSEAVIETIT